MTTTTTTKTAAAKKATPAKKTVATAKVEKKTTRPMPDGFTLGMKVTSSRDGLTYEVAGPDRSSAYVVLRNAEGKRVVRATKTLTPVKKRTARKG